jgi:NAD(P)-dependent dehydrogenase (short-subunit alcohol dehydrogenase family)
MRSDELKFFLGRVKKCQNAVLLKRDISAQKEQTRMFRPDALPYNNPQISKKVALLTGGNSGIGFFTVLHLYLHGYTVYIAGRNTNKIKRAIKEIEEEAQKRHILSFEDGTPQEEQTRCLGELKWIKVDLLNLNSVQNAAQKMKQLERHLDLLILNAGIGAVPHAISNDGFEVQFQTNYISHFLLTQGLSSVLNDQSRVIYVSSIAHYLELFEFSRDWTFNYKPNILFTWFRYAMAKSSGMQYMKLLSLKQNLQCFSVHPGFVMSTNFFSYWTRIPFIGIVFWLFFQVFGYIFGCSNEEGSYATLFCALADSPGPSGSYYSTGGMITTPGRVVNDMENISYNWMWTAKELRKRGYEVD